MVILWEDNPVFSFLLSRWEVFLLPMVDRGILRKEEGLTLIAVRVKLGGVLLERKISGILRASKGILPCLEAFLSWVT